MKNIDNQFAKTNAQLSEKLSKNSVLSMANMGQDVKEAMTGGSVAVVGRNTIVEENIVDNQVTPSKISFVDWENEKVLFNDSSDFRQDVNLGAYDNGFVVNKVSDSEIRYCAVIPIQANSIISVDAQDINRCRIGVAFGNELDGDGFPIRATKVVLNDDSLTSCKVEVQNKTGVYLIAYLGFRAEVEPKLTVKSRPMNSKILLSSDVEIGKIKPNQTSFIESYNNKRLNRCVFSSDGKYYYKHESQSNYLDYNLFVIDVSSVDVIKNLYINEASECVRVVGHKGYTIEMFEKEIATLGVGVGSTFGGEVLVSTTTTIFNCEKLDVSMYDLLVVYVGKNVVNLKSNLTVSTLNKGISVHADSVTGFRKETIDNREVEWEYDKSNKILSSINGVLYAYQSVNTDEKFCIHLPLSKRCTYTVDATSINRCRIGLFKNELEDITFGENSGTSSIVDKILFLDDDLKEVHFTFEAGEYKTAVFYLGIKESNEVPIPNVSIKYSRNDLFIDNLKLDSSNIPDGILSINSFDFDFDNKVREIVGNGIVINDNINDIDVIYEFPKASNEWVTDSTGKRLDITSDEFLAMFYDKHLGYHVEDGLRINKKWLGKDQSDTYDIYEYDFIPAQYSKTILLSSGMHTYELSAHFGLAHFFQEYMKYPYASDGFEYLRKNVRIKLIAISNPWGWNQKPYKTYGNCNGVNPNRNFDLIDSEGNSVWEMFPTYKSSENEWYVKGSAPFSESETRILRDWVLDNSNALFWIDCHTGLGYNQYDNWIVTVSNNSKLPHIDYAFNKLSQRIKNVYGTTSRNNREIDLPASIKHKWSCTVAKVPCLTIEQAPGNTLWGTSLNNDSGDITEYATYVYAYVIAQLKTKLI